MKHEAEYKGKIYPVWFKHDRVYERKNARDKLIIKGRTIAFIELDDDNIISAQAECSILDQYNKRLGRIIAEGRLKKKLASL